MSKAHIFSGL